MALFDDVKEVVVEQLNVNPEEVKEEAKFVEDLGADSLDVVELVMAMEEASTLGDIFITATGCNKVITTDNMRAMKEGAILSNAGHFNVEIDMDGLEKESKEKREVRENIVEYGVGDNRVFVIADGKLVNIAAADGHPAEIMDLSFAVQLLSALYINENKDKLENRLYQIPDLIDREIAEMKLRSWNVKIDSLNEEQLSYLNDWTN